MADNLYVYGPVDGPMTEDLPYSAAGPKGRARAEADELILDAHRSGRIRAALTAPVRAPGMTMFRLPIFIWNVLFTSILVLPAFPVLAAALSALCPPPRHNFTSIPRIRSFRPAFELKYPYEKTGKEAVDGRRNTVEVQDDKGSAG
ncbi:hypothetical protein ACFVH6_32890 [Spirillospora sp. NPDC127200]